MVLIVQYNFDSMKLRRTWCSRGVGLLSCQHKHTTTHVWYKSKRFKMISQSCVQKHWCVAVPEKPQQRHSHWTWSNQQSTTMRQYMHPKLALLCLYTCNVMEIIKVIFLLLNLSVKLTGWEAPNTIVYYTPLQNCSEDSPASFWKQRDTWINSDGIQLQLVAYSWCRSDNAEFKG